MASNRLKILVTNDDGFDAVGIRTLCAELAKFADIFIVAPVADCSGASYSVSLHGPVAVTVREGMLVVHGTPTDCIHMALHDGGAMPFRPDLTVSGINCGANLGYDILYSGTVAAAGESVMQGVPAIAFSLSCHPPDNFPPHNFQAASEIAAALVKKLAPKLIESPETLLNVNIPDLPKEELGTPEVTILGHQHYQISYSEQQRDDMVGLRTYKLAFTSVEARVAEGTDVTAVAASRISLTPLGLKVTAHDELEEVGEWTKSKDSESDTKLKILIANDDGYRSELMRGLMAKVGTTSEVCASVPLANNSGKAASLTLGSTLVVTFTANEGMRIVHGTPTDCVHLALIDDTFLPWRPDLTITGINYGPNLGNDVLYSGTIAAAAESVSLGIPAIAFSMGIEDHSVGPRNIETATAMAAKLTAHYAPYLLENPSTLLNINIPDLPLEELGGPIVCPLSQTWPGRKIDRVLPDETSSLHRFFIGEMGAASDAKADTDHALFSDGHVTISPLRFDLSLPSKIDEISKWLSES